jgi:hypothetical protein
MDRKFEHVWGEAFGGEIDRPGYSVLVALNDAND